MEIKDALLKKGLPIIIILAVIIGVAIYLSRPEPTPTVENPDKVVAKLEGKEVTKTELFKRIKNSASLSYILDQSDTAGKLYFLDMVDSKLLSEYTYEGIEDDIDSKIQFAKLMQGGDEQYQTFLSSLGLTESEAREYYKLTLLRKEAAKTVAASEVTDEAVTDALNAIRPDVCIVPLRFLNEKDAKDALGTGRIDVSNDSLDKDDILVNFKAEYENDTDAGSQKGIRMTGNVTDTECAYQKVSFSKASNTFTPQLLDYIKDMENDTYTTAPVSFEDGDDDSTNDDPYFYLIYKVSTDDLPTREDVKADLINQTVNASDYVNKTIYELRRDADLKIYDQALEDAYLAIDEDFKETEDTSDTTVLSFKVDGEKTKVSAEDLYQQTKMVFGVTKALPTINLGALESVDEVKLTRDEVREIKLEIKEMKAQFNSSQYAQYGITWPDFLNYYYGVKTEEEALEVEKLNRLQLDYINHIDPVTDEEVQTAMDDWFEIEATHLLFQCDTSKEDIDDKACELAKTEAQNVIDHLNTVAESKYLVELKAKVDDYTGDNKVDGLTVKTEDLGWFGPLVQQLNPQSGEPTGQYKRMVPEFETAAQGIAVGDYTDEPVKTSYGYHIIIKTNEKEASEYTNLKEDLTAKLETEHKAPRRVTKHMAELRDQLGFEFKDDELQEQYRIIQGIYLEDDSTDTE